MTVKKMMYDNVIAIRVMPIQRVFFPLLDALYNAALWHEFPGLQTNAEVSDDYFIVKA